jgi:hypothetical protein
MGPRVSSPAGANRYTNDVWVALRSSTAGAFLQSPTAIRRLLAEQTGGADREARLASRCERRALAVLGQGFHLVAMETTRDEWHKR